MTTLTQAPSMGDVLKWDANPNYTREAVTLLTGTSYAAGSVLGKITANGKYKLATATGTDGAQIASAVLLTATDATGADAMGVILALGPAIVSKAELAFDASVTAGALTDTKYAELVTVGIVPRTRA